MPEVTVLPHDVRVDARTDETVVDALRRAGWRSPYRCRRGGCGACKGRLVEGRVRYSLPVADSVLDDAERAAGLCLPCRAVPVTDVVLDLGAAPLRAVLATAPPWRL
ncbi:2Fe-2S iron-sulfur cluster-binding protein [Umezawaea endophytica]|uniref:2Fe-2S iron-sulfur cluster-binding protein n=1 Tax=Umezawaea endophytica TaxID=1654476 RepID=A0A9X2VFA1_9PSEU|nr:2Fe-2S iron-sulfur cluster-binding protein [Umezawaea endophytica]MCS7475541.1 2Fe-2S iron-sulfur cluster-binding protein [Umezawaea endophytica]